MTKQKWEHIALDGKRLCGPRDGEVPGTHLLAAHAPHASAVIARMTVEATTNEHKAALRLSDVLPALGGAVVPADAMFTHTDVCAAIRSPERSSTSRYSATAPNIPRTLGSRS